MLKHGECKGRLSAGLTRLWNNVGSAWQGAFKLCPHKDLGSWLFAKRSHQNRAIVTGLGCKACHLARSGPASWTTRSQCRKAKLQAHEQIVSHKRAVAAFGLCTECQRIDANVDNQRS